MLAAGSGAAGRRNKRATATALAVATLTRQQVMCKMALLSLVVLVSTPIAGAVGGAAAGLRGWRWPSLRRGA
jgi:hypothetical protein